VRQRRRRRVQPSGRTSRRHGRRRRCCVLDAGCPCFQRLLLLLPLLLLCGLPGPGLPFEGLLHILVLAAPALSALVLGEGHRHLVEKVAASQRDDAGAASGQRQHTRPRTLLVAPLDGGPVHLAEEVVRAHLGGALRTETRARLAAQ